MLALVALSKVPRGVDRHELPADLDCKLQPFDDHCSSACRDICCSSPKLLSETHTVVGVRVRSGVQTGPNFALLLDLPETGFAAPGLCVQQ